MNTTKLIEKIQKLHALSASSNIHEAALAASKMQDLLIKHNLTLAEVREKHADHIGRHVRTMSGRHRRWQHQLLATLARFNLCKTYRWNNTTDHVLIGTRENVEAVWFMWQRLSAEIERMSEVEWGSARHTTHTNKVRWKNSFCYGAVATIAKRLSDQHSQAVRSGHDGLALVLDYDAMLDEAFRRLEPGTRLSTSRTRVIIDRHADQQGRAFGKSIGMEKEIDSSPLALGAGR